MTTKEFTTAAALVLLTFATAPAAPLTEYYATSTAEALTIVNQIAAEGAPLFHVTIKTV